MNELSFKQFINLLNFIAIMSNSKYVLGLSPDYIIEKYGRYVNPDVGTINKNLDESGIHPVIRREIIEPYLKRWMNDIINTDDFFEKE